MEDNLVKNENEVVNTSNNPNSKNVIIAVLVVIIIALIGAIVYFAFIKKDDKPVNNNEENNQQQENNNQENGSNEKNIISNDEEMEIEINKISYNEHKDSLNKYKDLQIEENDNGQFLQYAIWNSIVELSSDGKVKITEENKPAVSLFNISSGKAIQGGVSDGYFYILLENGEVYYYDNSRYSDGIYTAVKLKDINNISKFVQISYCSKTDNLCVDEVGIVDKNDMYIELVSVIP